MNLLVTIFLACSTLMSTNAVPLASSGIIRPDFRDTGIIFMPGINFFRNEDHNTTTTTFNPPLMFGNINQHDTEIPVYFENLNQRNQAIAVLDNNSQLHSVGVSEKENDASSNEGNVVPSRVHFPGQNPIDRVPFPAAISEGEGSGGNIIYPSIINVRAEGESSTTLTDNVTTPAVGDTSQQQHHTQCGPQAGSIEVNGTCLTYLHKNGCSEDEWVVKTNDNRVECVLRPCPFGQLFHKGTCISVTDETICKDGQMLYVDFTGYVHCDCLPNFIYNPWTGTCFAEGDRSTCNFGEHVYIDEDDDGSVKCKKNPCLRDGLVFHNGSGRCFRKMYKGFCEDSYLITNVDNMTAECSAIASHSLFDLPAMRSCARGSLRDFSGSCRQRFRVPSVSSYPTLYGSCPGARFVKDSRGTCRRTHKLFG